MLFAAFEKKWWKALIGDQDTMSDDKNFNLDSNVRSEELSSDDTHEIEEAVKMTSPKAWKEGEDFINESEGLAPDEEVVSLDDELDQDEEVFVSPPSEYAEEGAYDLDGKELSDDDYYDEDEEKSRVREDIESAKEFFNTEVLYRYDILDDERRAELIGRYRIEIRGDKGGVWTLDVNEKTINVISQREDADLVLMLHHEDFLSIVNGKLNPQIALVSQRVKVSGDSKKASLFQNIMSPMSDY
jgi:hypothetical protein